MEAGLLVEISGDNIRHQPLGNCSHFSGDLRKLRLLLRGKMYFYSFNIRKSLGSGKWTDGPL
jgi:hypothetical protein